MNKNQKSRPCTYSSLIHGQNVVITFLSQQLTRFQKSLRKAKEQEKDTTELVEKIAYTRKQIDEHFETYKRYRMAQRVCGNDTILVR